MPRSSVISAPRFAALTLLVSALAAPGFAQAVARSWIGATGSTDAGTATNWLPNGIPTSADDLTFSTSNRTVDFPATVPQSHSQTFNGSAVYTLSTTGTHLVGVDLTIGQLLHPSAVQLTRGDLRCRHLQLGVAAGDYGRLSLYRSSPLSPCHFEETDSVQSGRFGTNGTGRIDLFGGADYLLPGTVYLAQQAAGVCTLNVSGWNLLNLQPSAFRAPHPNRGDMHVGHRGRGVVNIDGGGLVSLGRDMTIGGLAGGVGFVRLGSSRGTSTLQAQGTVLVGSGGSGTLQIEPGGLVRAGAVQVGPASGPPAPLALLRLSGGTLIADDFAVGPGSNGGFQLRDGLVHLHGGSLSVPDPWILSSSVGFPEFRIANANPANAAGAMIVGRGGNGYLRLAGAQTRLVSGAVTLADSSSGYGLLDVDSSATWEAFGAVVVGNGGTGTVRVRHGGTVRMHAGSTQLGHFAGSWGIVDVSGAGSAAEATGALVLGSLDPDAVAVNATVFVDSGAVLRTIPAGTGLIELGTGSAFLQILHGARVETGDLVVGDQLWLQGGTVVADVLNQGSAILAGHVIGEVTNAGTSVIGVIAAQAETLHVDGGFTQSAGGALGFGLLLGGEPGGDLLAVRDTMRFAGQLLLSTSGGTMPAVGDTFTLVTYAAYTGQFSSVGVNGLLAGPEYQLLYQPDRLRLTRVDPNVGVDDRGPAPQALRFAATGGPRDPGLVLELPSAADVTLELFDVSGRRVSTLQSGRVAAGRQTFELAGAGGVKAAGVYLAQLRVSSGEAAGRRTVKLVVLR